MEKRTYNLVAEAITHAPEFPKKKTRSFFWENFLNVVQAGSKTVKKKFMNCANSNFLNSASELKEPRTVSPMKIPIHFSPAPVQYLTIKSGITNSASPLKPTGLFQMAATIDQPLLPLLKTEKPLITAKEFAELRTEATQSRTKEKAKFSKFTQACGWTFTIRK